MEFFVRIQLSLPQSFINQKRKELEDEAVSEPLMQKHEQKIRHFGESVLPTSCGSYRIYVGLLLLVQNEC